MNNKVWIALILVVVAGGIFMLSQRSPEPEVISYTLEAAPILHRVEIVGAGGEEGADRVVLERRENQWWITRPVEVRMNRQYGEQIAGIFGRDIATDDLKIEGSQGSSYGLDEQEAVRVSVYTAGVDRAVYEILVGREMMVGQTGARRTFIQPVGSDQIYRAHGGFGDLVRTPVAEMRESSVVSVGTEGIEGVRLTHEDGHEVGINFNGTDWQLDGEMASYRIDQRRAARLAIRVGRLESMGFFEGEISELAFDPPLVQVVVMTGLETIELDVTRMEINEGTRYFVRRSDRELVYEISEEDAKALMMRLSELRDRSIIGAGSAALSEIGLAGSDNIRLLRGRQGWEMDRPAGLKLDQEKAVSLARFVGNLQTTKWMEEEIQLAGEDGLLKTVIIGIDGHETRLEIGRGLPGISGARYARYSEEPGIFVVSAQTVNRLTAEAEALTADNDG